MKWDLLSVPPKLHWVPGALEALILGFLDPPWPIAKSKRLSSQTVLLCKPCVEGPSRLHRSSESGPS